MINASHQYLRHSTLPIDQVLHQIKLHSEIKGKAYVEFDFMKVKINGLRLQTFASKGCVCSSCGLLASYFAIESNSKGNSWHLNLWGIRDSQEILFTHDHTIDRAEGGLDNLSNSTTMCSPCNNAKAIASQRSRKSK